MTLNIIDWPVGLPIQKIDWFISGSKATAGAGLDGQAQFTGIENRKWIASVTMPALEFEQMETFKVLVDELDGPLNTLKLPVRNPLALPRTPDESFWLSVGLTEADIANGYITFDDGEVFDDGLGFALPVFSPATVFADAPEGASNLQAIGVEAEYFPRRSFFEVNNFIYRVSKVLNGTMTFNPPLREALTAGTVLNTENIFVQVRLSSDDAGRLLSQFERYSDGVQFDVVEVFER